MTTATTQKPASRRTTTDAVLTAAVDLARSAAEDVGGGAQHVGPHIGAQVDGERLVTHFFECLDRGYHGWRWSVTVARVARSKHVTVDEAVLLPGTESLLAPAWVPWNERLKPGDLGVGDLLPTEADDDRLEAGYAATGDDDADQIALWELGLGRVRVLSPIGRDDAIDRWYTGERGPDAPIAQAAPAHCSTCGFYVPLAGVLRQVFGVCANEYSPGDGTVVSADHGCGAHSEVAVIPGPIEVTPPLVDEMDYDVVARKPEHPPGSVDDAAPAEDLGHS